MNDVMRSPFMRLLLGRLMTAVPVLFGVSLLTFVILGLMPGNAAQLLLGADAAPEQVARLAAELELDRPAAERYFEWLTQLLRGDLGASLANGLPVRDLIADRLPVTLELVVLALVLSTASAVGLAVLTAQADRRTLDRAIAALTMGGLSLPNYVLALVLVLMLAVNARLFPAIGVVPLSEGVLGNLRSMTLPAIALAFPFFSLYTRFLLGDLREQLEGRAYIVTARAKGLAQRRVVLCHALPNSVLGLVTVVGLNVGALISGTVIIEQIFALPGIGQLLLQAISTRDIVVVQGIVLVTASATVCANLCVDLLYLALDPRIRHAAA